MPSSEQTQGGDRENRVCLGNAQAGLGLPIKVDFGAEFWKSENLSLVRLIDMVAWQ
jgi:hypothetical protein